MAEFEDATGYTDAGDLTLTELNIPGVLERLVSTLNNDAAGRGLQQRRANWWWCETSAATPLTYIGRITLIFDPPVRRGHIDLAVRPSRRREGHGLAMIQAVLPIAAGWGITEPTLVVRLDNTAGRALVEAAGAVLDFEAPEGLAKYHLVSVPSTV